MTISDNLHFPRIRKLATSVANQIAAGEVIERPASVVKELIENSIDAAANNIHIDIEKAGISLIRVRDDGQGIYKDDLKLALQAHATSKLFDFSDLSQIASLGFRGEAIPSIASVSRFKMTSRLSGQEQAWSIDNECNVKPAAHETGTTVEVNDLFFSTPGRRKFLKSEKTEFLHIQSLIRSLSLSHFATGFYVKHNAQSLYHLPACKDNVELRVKHICGNSFLNKSVPVDVEKEGLRLWGWLGLNDVARSQSDRQYFYVNGRMVRNKHVNHAIRLAYDDRIATGRYPSFVLHLNLDPSLLDINVHPAKSEVRFANTRDIHDFIYGSLLDALKPPTIVTIDNRRHNDTEYDLTDMQTHDTKQYGVNEAVGHYLDKPLKESFQLPPTSFQQVDSFNKKQSSVRYFSLFAEQFVITDINQEHYLIDIKKTNTLVTTTYLLDNWKTNKIIKRPILVPLGLELPSDKMALIQHHAALIAQWGFELEQISPNQIRVRSIPARLVCAETVSLVNDLLNTLKRNKPANEVAATLAKHINDSGITLNKETMSQLISDILKSENHQHAVLPWKKLTPSLLQSWLEK